MKSFLRGRINTDFLRFSGGSRNFVNRNIAAPKTGSSQRLAIFAIAGVVAVRHIMAMITHRFAWQILREMNFANL